MKYQKVFKSNQVFVEKKTNNRQKIFTQVNNANMFYIINIDNEFQFS